MPFPTSPQSLYHNLLSITSIPSAIDYYFDSPRALHSTRSFNLLISLALRSASFASARRLFTAMQAESIPPNMETWKLHVRWFVRTGKWNDAWKRALEISGNSNKPIPLPLWLELFGSQKRGALRHWVITDRKPNVQAGPAAYSGHDIHLDAGLENGEQSRMKDDENSTPCFRKRLVPRPCQSFYAVQLSRYRALMQVSPLLTPSDQVQILPRTVLIITQIMYQVGQSSLALSTALSYLESLPPRIRRCDRRRILDLVNSHLSMATRHRKQGLKQHFAQRRILWKFLHARPDLAPSSTTLFLLLGSLRGCRRSGTLAMQCLQLFEKRWGPHVQSSLVRRRVASLALKEGRLDIVAAMIRLESRCRAFTDALPRTVYTSRRGPWRTLFSRRGAENRRWHIIVERYRRRVMLKSDS
ncbi:hypothetical protein JVT61DRAFT_5507 [Boletus reticuloceps]|uniref:Pentatricopeptide repeat-containing protein n=1 Tax=Boletus reticuloceps TaxID=495285 RepID=A0A8I2YXI8_9AGAM|nr:hypothetical protein JVT61DRAFT_5507 [Boletus reticuloceps]